MNRDVDFKVRESLLVSVVLGYFFGFMLGGIRGIFIVGFMLGLIWFVYLVVVNEFCYWEFLFVCFFGVIFIV